MKVLWLASWYPNKYEPVNGDFVQRHAKAVAQYLPIDVIHVVQLGKDLAKENFENTHQQHPLREFIYGFAFKKIGIGWIDKIRYNLVYQQFYVKKLEQYFHQFGKPDLIHVHVPMKAGLAALQIKRKYNIPFIVSEQASYYEDASPDNFNKRSYFFRKNTSRVFKNAQLVTNVSATIGKVIQQLFQLKKVECVHNVVDASLFNVQPKKLNITFQWVHVSTLGEQKNIEGLLAAFKIVLQQTSISCQLQLVGPNVQPHIATVQQFNLQNQVSFVGEVAHHQVAQYLQQANAFVLFSRHENFPCVIPEALCCGLPVVASNVGGVAEAIHEQNGFVVPSNNVEALANAMIALMNNYTNYNSLYIANEAKAKYASEIIGQQFIEVYKKLLEHY
jgi:glycosyltransferase involved in cell wall biosynthesis